MTKNYLTVTIESSLLAILHGLHKAEAVNPEQLLSRLELHGSSYGFSIGAPMRLPYSVHEPS